MAESSTNIASTEEKSTCQRLSEAESEVSAVHTSSGTSVNEATEATVSFGEGAESGRSNCW